MTPIDVVPSLLQVIILPMCEGIGVGLLGGCLIIWAMKVAERFFAPVPRPLPDRSGIIPIRPPIPCRVNPPVLPSNRLPTKRRPLARAC
jgi:hypothetical protein